MKKRQSGIYQIQCKATGERYVGSSIDIPARFVEHRYDLNLSNHHNRKLLAEWERHGGEIGFEFSVIEECPPDKVVEREQYWLDTLKPELNIAIDSRRPGLGRKVKQSTIDKMSIAHLKRHAKNSPERKEQIRQNIQKGRQKWWDSLSPEEQAEFQNGLSHPHTDETKRILSEKTKANPSRAMLGKHHSDETKAKLRAALTGRKMPPMSDEQRDGIRKRMTGSHPSAETIRKMADSKRGKKLTDEHKQKLSDAHKGRPGRPATDETKEKLRQIALAQQADPEYLRKHAEGLKAVMSSPEMRDKLSKAHKGKKLSAEHAANIGKATKGKKRSEATKLKMREAQLARWAKRKQNQGK